MTGVVLRSSRAASVTFRDEPHPSHWSMQSRPDVRYPLLGDPTSAAMLILASQARITRLHSWAWYAAVLGLMDEEIATLVQRVLTRKNRGWTISSFCPTDFTHAATDMMHVPTSANLMKMAFQKRTVYEVPSRPEASRSTDRKPGTGQKRWKINKKQWPREDGSFEAQHVRPQVLSWHPVPHPRHRSWSVWPSRRRKLLSHASHGAKSR